MRKVIILALGLLMSFPIFASISNIEKDGSWYRFYNENGKQYKSANVATYGELKGYSASLVIFQDGAFFYVYDSELKKLKSCAVATYGEVISVSGETFTTKMGNWIYTYDKSGKKLNSRAAN